MNVTQETIDDLNARVVIEIAPADYEEPVRKVLDHYRKQMKLQGFRPGKVPFGVAKKMYGKAVLVEELNKIISEKLQQHIKDNELNILGQPLSEDMDGMQLDFDKKFEFKYDLGLAPRFEVNLSNKDKFTQYKITVDNELVDKYVRDFQRRYGKSEEVEVTTEKDMIYGCFHELDKTGEHKKGGVHNHSTIVVEYVENKEAKAKLIGVAKESKLTVEPAKLCKGDADLSAMLGVPVSELSEVGKQFEMTVESIHRIDPHPLDQALFDRVLGPNMATTEEEFRTRIASDLEKHLVTDSDKKLRKDISDKLLEKLKLQLPDEFLKRWLLDAGSRSEKKITQDDIDKEYDDYSRFMKLQLIENQVAKENTIKVEYAEIEGRIKENIRNQFASFGQGGVDEELINQFAENFLKKQEEVRRVYEQLFDEKIMQFYKNTVKLQEKEVSFDEFVKLASTKPGKGKFMDQISNLLKF